MINYYKIAFIDDYEDDLKTFKPNLGKVRKSWELVPLVVWAKNEEELSMELKRIKGEISREKPDAILLDIAVLWPAQPDTSRGDLPFQGNDHGFDWIQPLEIATGGVPIIMFSAYGETIDPTYVAKLANKANNRGASIIFWKNEMPSDIVNWIESIIRY